MSKASRTVGFALPSAAEAAVFEHIDFVPLGGTRVLVVVVAVMGWRMALLVGLTIPGAFLTGILLVWAFGFTLNIVVLFALILVAGMLVDGAIVVSELADRHLHEGQTAHQAWLNAASRMSWPVIASTATTLAVFLPLLFWPGVVGQFMKYMPITLIATLSASLANQTKTIRLPVHIVDKLFHLRKAEVKLHELLGRIANNAEALRA